MPQTNDDDMGVAKLCDASYVGDYQGSISDIENVVGFIPKAVGASSTTKVCDFYYQYSSEYMDYWRIPMFGDIAYLGDRAGVFTLLAVPAFSDDAVNMGSRLCF